jgi:anti-sigma regulatory factor (Ser/Thr protein kinase)
VAGLSKTLNERGRCTACHLKGGTESIRKAREHTRGFLSDAEPAISDGTVQDVLLAVSELVTNAVQHAPGPCTLEVELDERSVLIGVTDTSDVAPVLKPPRFNGSGGLGLHMLRKLAGDVETLFHEGGKTVRVCLTRTAK